MHILTHHEKNGRIIFRRGEAGRNADLKASASGI